MRRRKNRGRNINGVLLLDKPAGITSNAALQAVKHLYNASKAGHTGSLDPLASGLLPLCMGQATKESSFLLDADKHYSVTGKLGVITATGDAEGEIVETCPVQDISRERVEAVLDTFRGPIEQIPPMYSALKHEGQRLYKLARQGIEVERKPRSVVIHKLELTGLSDDEFSIDVSCTKGTYIRTLAEDIGRALDCGAHVIWLRRTGVGPYGDSDLVTLETVEKTAESGFQALDALLLPIETALGHWPEVRLSSDAAFYLRQGQPVVVPHAPTQGWVRLYNSDRAFMGVGQVQDDGKVAPRRMMGSG